MERYPSPNAPTVPLDQPLINVTGEKSDRQKADELLAAFDQLPADERRKALAALQCHDPDRMVLVRRPDGSISSQEVSPEARARILGMGAAGFESVSFNNRANRRRQKALARTHGARRDAPKRSP